MRGLQGPFQRWISICICTRSEGADLEEFSTKILRGGENFSYAISWGQQ